MYNKNKISTNSKGFKVVYLGDTHDCQVELHFLSYPNETSLD